MSRRHTPSQAHARSACAAFGTFLVLLGIIALLPEHVRNKPSSLAQVSSTVIHSRRAGGKQMNDLGHSLNRANDPAMKYVAAKRSFDEPLKAGDSQGSKIPLLPLKILLAIGAVTALISSCVHFVRGMLATLPQPAAATPKTDDWPAPTGWGEGPR